jgi:hypothetical protein
MNQLNEVRSKLRSKKAAYRDLRNDYDLLIQNVKANVAAKKIMRDEMAVLTKEFQRLKKENEANNPRPKTTTEDNAQME